MEILDLKEWNMFGVMANVCIEVLPKKPLIEVQIWKATRMSLFTLVIQKGFLI